MKVKEHFYYFQCALFLYYCQGVYKIRPCVFKKKLLFDALLDSCDSVQGSYLSLEVRKHHNNDKYNCTQTVQILKKIYLSSEDHNQ
jgi:hypothetical protein